MAEEVTGSVIQKYDLNQFLVDDKKVIPLEVRSNSIVPISLPALQALTPVPENGRAPNKSELLRLADIALGQGADPYAGECGLLPVWTGGFHYEPWVAAQVRLRKAQAQLDYRGYQWGYITQDFTRHNAGRDSKVNPDEVIGIWGQVFRDGKEPFYHETWMKESQKGVEKGKGSWAKAPITMLLKVNRDQAHKFAFADQMGNLNTNDELQAYNQLELPECQTPPRAARRKPAQDVRVTDGSPSEPGQAPAEQEVAPDTDGSRDADGATPADNTALIMTLYQGLVNDYAEQAFGGGDMDFDAKQASFTEFAAWVLVTKPEKVCQARYFTMPMIEAVKAKLNAGGLQEWMESQNAQ